MKRFAVQTLLAVSFVSFSAVAVSAATPVTLETSVQSAQKSLEQKQYRRAETTLRKALDAAVASGPKDAATANAHLLLAKILREAGKASDASEALTQAYAIYKVLGFVDPKFVEETKNLADNFQRIDVALLGSASDVLRNNGAEVSITKSTSGGHVEIKIAAPFETTLNNPKVDGVQLEKLVSFDIEASQPGVIHVSSIKGFKIHSIEKNTWANLLDIKTGAVDSEGKYDAEVTAGKAGFTKTVAAKLPIKAYQPVEALSKQLSVFGTVVAVDLPVQSPAATAATTQAVTEAPQTVPSVETTPAVTEAPQTLPSVETTQAKPVSEADKPIVVEPSKPVHVESKPVATEPAPVAEVKQVIVEDVKPAEVVPSQPALVRKEPVEAAKNSSVHETKTSSVEEAKPAVEKSKASDDCSGRNKVKTSGANPDHDSDDDDDDDDDDDKKDGNKNEKNDKDD